MAPKNHALHDFLQSTGNKVIYRDKSVGSIIKYLNLGSPPMRLTISSVGQNISSNDKQQMSIFGGQTSWLPMNCQILASMNIPVLDVDDATIEDNVPLGLIPSVDDHYMITC